jgi:hypothetical protein
MDELICTEMNQGTMDDYHPAASLSTIPIKIIDIVCRRRECTRIPARLTAQP